MKSYLDYNLATTLKDSNDPLLKMPEYFKIMEVLDSLKKNNMLQTFHGNCIAACEITQSMLSQVGIQSRMIEVELLITRKGQQNEFLFIGFDDANYSGQIDTHMVLITDTPQPILIDLSIAYVLPADRSYLIERVNSKNQTLSEHNIENLSLVYREKKSLRFANIHQKNIISKLLDEQKFRKEFEILKLFLMISLAISAINFTLNSVLILLKITHL